MKYISIGLKRQNDYKVNLSFGRCCWLKFRQSREFLHILSIGFLHLVYL